MKFNTGIYQIVNQVNGKRYIGSAVDIYGRKRVHFSELKNNKHHCYHLQHSYNKYGKENFKFETILHCSKEHLIFFEQKHIDKYNFNKELYNIRKIANSNLGTVLSEETKNKISKKAKGRKASKETKEKLSKMRMGSGNNMFGKPSAMKGKKHSEETKRKIGESQRGEKNHNYGKKASKETREKMSEVRKGKYYGKKGKENSRAKAVFQIDKDSLKIVKKWECIADIKRELGIDHCGISNVCHGRNKTTGGFIWAFTNSDLSKIKRIGKRTATGKSIYQIDIKTNEMIKIWDKIKQASEELNINKSCISAVCRGKRNHAGGFKWKFVKR